MKAKEDRPDIHIRVTKRTFEYLVSVAEAMDRSVSYLVEHIIADWIERKRQPNDDVKAPKARRH